jgi:hypothetical protein
MRFRPVQALLALAIAASSCRGTTSQTGVSPLVAEFDPDAICALPGYRAGVVNEPIFGGEAFVMEAGPTDAPSGPSTGEGKPEWRTYSRAGRASTCAEGRAKVR